MDGWNGVLKQCTLVLEFLCWDVLHYILLHLEVRFFSECLKCQNDGCVRLAFNVLLHDIEGTWHYS